MRHLVKWLVILGIAFVTLTAGFTLYANFLLDYSLDNLEQAVSAADRNNDASNPLLHSLYQNMTQDLAVEEAFRGKDASIEQLTLLDFASRSFGETGERIGNKRAGVYLNQMVERRKAQRHPALRLLDEIYYRLRKLYSILGSVVQYFQKKIARKEKVSTSATPYSSLFLLNQADQKQKTGQLPEAVELYRKFLDLYPDVQEKGFARIALANALIRSGELDEAQTHLLTVQKEYFGLEEERIAAAWLKKVSLLKERQALIESLKTAIESPGDPVNRANATLKLGLAYLSSYRFEEAVKILQDLSQNSPDVDARQKAGFYLAWAHKMNSQYSQSLEVLNKLLEDPALQGELALGLKAQQADLYHLQNDPQNAITSLGELKRSAASAPASGDVARQAWVSLSDIEQGSIYLFDIGDQAKGRELLDLGSRTAGVEIEGLTEQMTAESQGNAVDRAFQALKVGKVNAAYEIFEKHLKNDPRNPWLHSGLATVYLLFGETQLALNYAQRGHQLLSDAYTSSILAYVHSFRGDNQKAIDLYKSVIETTPDYIPAQFNVGCLYLDIGEYQNALDMFSQLEKNAGPREKYLHSKILNNMGLALWNLGRSDEARQQFESSMKFTPNFAVARQNLSLMASGQAPQMVQLKE